MNKSLIEKLELKQYKKLYETFDGGHDVGHMQMVMKNAVTLGKLYLPEEVALLELAALLHDIGLSKSRDNHEVVGAKMIKQDKYLQQVLTKTQLAKVVSAVAQHRSSTGNPTTMFDKIIADADSMSPSPGYMVFRSVMYGMHHAPELTIGEQITRGVIHLNDKYVNKKAYNRYYTRHAIKVAATNKMMLRAMLKMKPSLIFNSHFTVAQQRRCLKAGGVKTLNG